MNRQEILKAAQAAIGDKATVSLHAGDHGAWGIRIHQCYPGTARDLARLIAPVMGVSGDLTQNGGNVATDAGFICVWA